MNIQFLYFEGCPSHQEAMQRLRDVLTEMNQFAMIETIRVETDAEAKKYQFVGSPTIRINGEDIDPVPPDATYGLTCRVYRWEDGRVSPLPSPSMIRRGIEKARQHAE
ncbi:MAG: DUF2703 domain-containing protein [Phototrophicales bacterium]|nr:MAG: DUF2703 domain-containing protein [Phototrophicales bacterium]